MSRLPPEVLTLAQRGKRLFPLRPNSKLPYPDYHWNKPENSTSDLGRLEFMNDRFPNSNWAMLCGDLSNVDVLDFDIKGGKDGIAWYQHQLEQCGPALAETIRVRTPSGGSHNWYQHIPGIGTKKSVLAPGVDVQGQGAYVLVPPSVINGVPYQFEDCDAESDIAPLPQDLRTEILRLFQERSQPQASPPRTNGEAKIPSGQRHQFLLHHAGQLLHCGLGLKALAYQLVEDSETKFQEPYAREEIYRQAQDFFNRWQKNPVDLYHEFRRSFSSSGKANGMAKLEAHLTGRWLSDVEEREVEYLRDPDVPLRGLTLLSGDPGAGKTWLAMELSARVTNQGGVVIYLTNENPAEEVLKPRFRSLGGEMSKFRVIDGVEFRHPETGDTQFRAVTLQDVIILETEIAKYLPLLVVCDPLQSFLGANVDAHRSNETRPVMDGLLYLAKKYKFAGFILRHCAKNASGKALYRGIGSIDFTAAARSELLAVEISPGKFAMAHVKNNVGIKGVTREFSISGEKDGVLSKTGFFTWGSTLDLSANDLIAEDRIDHRLEEAEDFLREKLSDGAQLATDLADEAKQVGISLRTLRRARKKLNVKAYKRVDRRWEWHFEAKMA